MNRRQKIIISVTGIFLVLLILVGLTYAYFLTRINGNPNNTSISVTTANLELTYTDGNGILTPVNALVPGDDVKFLDGEKNIQESKTFSVTNNGEDTEYVVFIDNVQVKYATTSGTQTAGTSTTFESNDFRYALTCTITSSDNERNNTSCNKVENGVFPFTNKTIIVGNDILKGDVHNYTLTMKYIETGKNQSNDMNKGFSAKIDIEDIHRLNPYSDNKDSLAYNIINNAVTKKNGTELMATPLTRVAEEISSYGSGEYEKIYYWEEGGYEWDGLTYGATQDLAEQDREPSQIAEGTDPVQACNSVIGQYISDRYYCNYDGCDSIGKVVGCENDGTPILEENEGYPTWEEGGYEWDYLTYGATQSLADDLNPPSEIAEGTDPVQACNSVIGQYISDLYYCNYDGCSSIGKVVGCESDGTPILEDNYYEKEIMLPEQTLSVIQDDLGTSYYFRGNVEDNYVNFAGMCWRIVRIAGDGSTKLILEDQYTTCDDTETETTTAIYTGNWNIGKGNYGYDSSSKSTSGSTLYKMNYLNPVTNNTSSMVKAFYDFQTTKLADYTGKLKSGNWCLGDKAYTRSGSSGSYTYTLLEDTSSNYLSKTSFYYDASTRLTSGNANGYQPTLKCNGTILNEFADVSGVSSKAPMYVSAITADEIVYAGGKAGAANGNYYLINNYQKSNSSYFWSLSPDGFNGTYDYAFRVYRDGSLNGNSVYIDFAFRPSVSLASSAVISSGEGTIDKPYIIG